MLSLALPFAGAISVVLTILHILICVFLIFVVLLQRGRNQDLASAFGGGQTMANPAAMSTDDFLTRATKVSAFAFMVTSLLLALVAQNKSTSVLDTVPGNDVPTAEEQAADEAAGASAPAAEETPAPATDGSAAPATDGSAAPAADGSAAPATDGSAAPAATDAAPVPAGSSGQ